MMPIRVRQIIDSLSDSERTSLKKLLPQNDIKMPTEETYRYPNALLTAFPKGSEYSLLGFTAEEMLRLSKKEINIDSLVAAAKKFYPDLSEAAAAKISKSKTTAPFLERLKKTRRLIEAELDEPLQGETELTYQNFMGHPDARTSDQIFEMKLTGQINKNWTNFLFQIFAYAALDFSVKHIYLVLPLQEHLWYCNVEEWSQRSNYRDFFNNKAAVIIEVLTTPPEELLINRVAAIMMPAAHIVDRYNIGSHIQKQKKMKDIAKHIINKEAPHQIFLGGPQSSKLSISDIELAVAAAIIDEHSLKLYIHSPYIINLSQEVDECWNVKLLKKHLI